MPAKARVRMQPSAIAHKPALRPARRRRGRRRAPGVAQSRAPALQPFVVLHVRDLPRVYQAVVGHVRELLAPAVDALLVEAAKERVEARVVAAHELLLRGRPGGPRPVGARSDGHVVLPHGPHCDVGCVAHALTPNVEALDAVVHAVGCVATRGRALPLAIGLQRLGGVRGMHGLLIWVGHGFQHHVLHGLTP
eukprot:CAMPEP_0206008582 /NCGR_PEP_ID=MMETSP1464-20131121/7753_1 /ASSEMBLY_ACC=CAM_ASM_001124 /TAXON_ID=119497 /ORGANISM="Exanthemachrysis gayraliae, Strain RCC1523" /LENGTH=192 /DNA_ID=CAMNT_0053382127 /DNA_START=415 /DNA_END=989 /DNA_ORIENTATION=-